MNLRQIEILQTCPFGRRGDFLWVSAEDDPAGLLKRLLDHNVLRYVVPSEVPREQLSPSEAALTAVTGGKVPEVAEVLKAVGVPSAADVPQPEVQEFPVTKSKVRKRPAKKDQVILVPESSGGEQSAEDL